MADIDGGNGTDREHVTGILRTATPEEIDKLWAKLAAIDPEEEVKDLKAELGELLRPLQYLLEVRCERYGRHEPRVCTCGPCTMLEMVRAMRKKWNV